MRITTLDICVQCNEVLFVNPDLNGFEQKYRETVRCLNVTSDIRFRTGGPPDISPAADAVGCLGSVDILNPNFLVSPDKQMKGLALFIHSALSSLRVPSLQICLSGLCPATSPTINTILAPSSSTWLLAKQGLLQLTSDQQRALVLIVATMTAQASDMLPEETGSMCTPGDLRCKTVMTDSDVEGALYPPFFGMPQQFQLNNIKEVTTDQMLESINRNVSFKFPHCASRDFNTATYNSGKYMSIKSGVMSLYPTYKPSVEPPVLETISPTEYRIIEERASVSRSVDMPNTNDSATTSSSSSTRESTDSEGGEGPSNSSARPETPRSSEGSLNPISESLLEEQADQSDREDTRSDNYLPMSMIPGVPDLEDRGAAQSPELTPLQHITSTREKSPSIPMDYSESEFRANYGTGPFSIDSQDYQM